jgi:sugar lactone lactonase YvrE
VIGAAILAMALAAPAETAWVVPPGQGYPESLLVDPDGAITVSIVFRGMILKHQADGSVITLGTIPDLQSGEPGFVCIARGDDGRLYATASRKRGEVWRIDETGGAPTLIAALPEGAQPNGIAADGRGGLILGDNLGGLWWVDPASGSAARWLEHPELTRHPGGRYPAANGVQRHGAAIYVTNSDRAQVVRIMLGDAGQPGNVAVVASGVPGDDFAIDSAGTAYVTTHPSNSLIVVDDQGRTDILVGAEEGMVGPTAATIAIVGGVRWLYVATDGGAFEQGGTPAQPPAIVRLVLTER